jgi:hypothetical protein
MINAIDVMEAIRFSNGKHKRVASSEAAEAIEVDK